MTTGLNTIERRTFLKQAGLAGTALVLGVYASACTPTEPEGEIRAFRPGIDDIPEGTALGAFVIIDANNSVTIMSHRPDMGQGTFFSVPLIIAEELGVDPSAITIKKAPGDEKYGPQGVGGSASIRSMWEPMRKVGATARQLLLEAAAQTWGVTASDCSAKEGWVWKTGGTDKLSFGELAPLAATLPIPAQPTLKAIADFAYIGKSVPNPSVPAKVTGTADFAMDIQRPGMVYAVVERAPFGATLKTLDDQEAKAVVGVEQVLQVKRPVDKHTFDGVAVVANSYWAALKARKLLKIEWEMPEQLLDSGAILGLCHQEIIKDEAAVVIRSGDAPKAFAAANQTLDLVYETPFAAHAAMEPQNVVVEITDQGCELWIGNQFPEDVKKEAATFLGLDPTQVQVHMAFMGGGFGRKSQTDVAMEALAVAKAVNKPVKLIWTREDDIRQSAMRPPTVNRLKGALDERGKLVSLEHTVAAPSLAYGIWGMHSPERIPGFLVEPMGEHVYLVPNLQANFALVDVDPLPITWWRSVYASTNAFGHECFIDEMAALAGKDPFDFRMEMMTHNPRFMRLMDKLRSLSGWDTPMAEGKARGVAVVKSFESTVGHVVEVSRRENGEARVDKVYSVVDCGLAIHPDTVKAQVEGSIVMGLSAAVKPGLTVKNSAVVEGNFHDYPVLRIHETPTMDIHILESEEDPTGIGEPALPPLAPALANALYALGGQRIRKLPIDLSAV